MRDITYVPPTEEPFRTMPGTDLLTAKLASQSAEVETETPTGMKIKSVTLRGSQGTKR